MKRVLFAVTIGAGLHSAMGADLTVISFPRADQVALTKAYYSPFKDATGLEIQAYSYDGQTSDIEAQIKANKTEWDVMQVESGTLMLGCQMGLFQKLDYAKIGNTADFIPGAVSECGVGMFAWSMALAYDANRVQIAPKSWADFWDVKKFPGKRGLRRTAKYTLEIALLADGVAPADVYKVLSTPKGVDRAFAKLDQIKADVVWWDAAAQPSAMLGAGQLAMTPAYTLFVDVERKRGKNLAIAWNQSLYDVDSWAIPQGSPKTADAYRFIAFASKPAYQKVLAETIAYGPSNKLALPLLDAKLASNLPTSEANLKRALKVDIDFWIRNGAPLEHRFVHWVPRACPQQTDEDGEDEAYMKCQEPHPKPGTHHH